MLMTLIGTNYSSFSSISKQLSVKFIKTYYSNNLNYSEKNIFWTYVEYSNSSVRHLINPENEKYFVKKRSLKSFPRSSSDFYFLLQTQVTFCRCDASPAHISYQTCECIFSIYPFSWYTLNSSRILVTTQSSCKKKNGLDCVKKPYT